MKTYLIPLAILVGSIIISVSVYFAITSKERIRFNHCVETYSKNSSAPLKETKNFCKTILYSLN
mgnify:CR=1 FL=1